MPHPMLDFHIADVFTRRPYMGNQLAVIPGADGLNTMQMQKIAREFNFAETTFVLPSGEASAFRRVRIFTPRSEMPFAGHPTLGTAAVLAEMGAAARSGEDEIIFQEEVGPVGVAIRKDGPAWFCRLSVSGAPEFRPSGFGEEAVARLVSLDPEDVLASWFAALGPRFFFARLASKAAVDRASLNRAQWSGVLKDAWSPHVFIFSGDLEPGSSQHARMFAPAAGIEEDPATGSASGILAGVLAGDQDTDGDFVWNVVQGEAMGRRSDIEAGARRRGRRVTGISVGGHSVVHASGRIQAPPTDGD